MTKETVLITGSSGLIGAQLLAELSKDYFVYGLSRTELIDPRLNHTIPVSCIQELEAVDFKPDIIVHTAGQSAVWRSWADPVNDCVSNIEYTIRLANYANRRGVKKFIYYSSEAIYGDNSKPNELSAENPKSPYGLSKLTGERYLSLLLEPTIALISLIPSFVIGAKMTRNILYDAYKDGSANDVTLNCTADSIFNFVTVHSVIQQTRIVLSGVMSHKRHILGAEFEIGPLLSKLDSELGFKRNIEFIGTRRIATLKSVNQIPIKCEFHHILSEMNAFVLDKMNE